MIRRMNEEDLDRIVQIEKDLFPSGFWPRKEFIYEMQENPFACLLVLEEEGKIQGYGDLWIMYEQAQVANIAIVRSCQGQGKGSELLQAMISLAEEKNCETMSLEVRLSNTRAIALYEKFGFIQANIRKNYYEDGEDAYLMIKPLGGAL
jgi:ribosomal-protein-alanine N-acetyltransferase